MKKENNLLLSKIEQHCIYGTTMIDGKQTHLYFPAKSISYVSVIHEENNYAFYVVILFMNNNAIFTFRHVTEEQLNSIYEMINQ